MTRSHPILRRTVLTVAAASLFLPCLAMAQDLHPSRRPSPMGMARISLDDTYVRVVYSRPYERGRDNIFGTAESEALVPYGEVWRTGANEASEITVTGDVLIANEPLAAGTYSLFTTPGPEEWAIHFSPELGLSGTGHFDPEAQEFTPLDVAASAVLTVIVPAQKAEEKVEQFTISFDRVDETSADMVLAWIETEVRVPVKVAE